MVKLFLLLLEGFDFAVEVVEGLLDFDLFFSDYLFFGLGRGRGRLFLLVVVSSEQLIEE